MRSPGRVPAVLLIGCLLVGSAGLGCGSGDGSGDGSGCGSARRPPPPARRIVAVTTVEPDTWSPLLAASGTTREVLALVARDLVVEDATWETVPELAAAVPSLERGGARFVDGRLLVTWTLRDGARWEDGTPMTAADFLLGWRVQTDPTQEIVVGRDDAQRIERLEPSADGRSFTVTWREPNPFFADPRVHLPLPSHVVGPRIVDEHQHLRPLKDDPIARTPLSNGPFRLVEHVPGQHMLFRRNEHATPRPLVDEVLVKVVPSTSTALTLLVSGDAHLVLPSGGPSPVEARAFVAKNPARFALETAPGQVWTHIDINLDHPWLADVRVRRALAAAIPRREIFDGISGGLYEVAESYLPPRHWGHAALAPLVHDPGAARALLDDAGWKETGTDGVRRNARGERLSLQLAAAAGQPETEQLLVLVKKALLDVGVEVNLDLRPFKVFFGEGARKRKLPHLSFYSWTLDGSSMGGALWRKDKIPTEENGWKGQNLPGWKNDEATALLTQADATLELPARQRMLRRVQELVREELPAIPMYFRPVVVVHDKAVKNLRPTGTQTPLAWNAAWWDLTAER